jgi:hypothetical protein
MAAASVRTLTASTACAADTPASAKNAIVNIAHGTATLELTARKNANRRSPRPAAGAARANVKDPRNDPRKIPPNNDPRALRRIRDRLYR